MYKRIYINSEFLKNVNPTAVGIEKQCSDIIKVVL